MERYGSQRKYSGANWPGQVGAVSLGTSVEMAGHVQRMSDDRIAKQVLQWVPEDRRKRGRPRVTWQHVVIKDFEKGGLSWEEAMSLTAEGREWRNWIAHCEDEGLRKPFLTPPMTDSQLLLLSCAKSHMLSASRQQPHLLHVSAVDRRQTWSMDKS